MIGKERISWAFDDKQQFESSKPFFVIFGLGLIYLYFEYSLYCRFCGLGRGFLTDAVFCLNSFLFSFCCWHSLHKPCILQGAILSCLSSDTYTFSYLSKRNLEAFLPFGILINVLDPLL